MVNGFSFRQNRFYPFQEKARIEMLEWFGTYAWVGPSAGFTARNKVGKVEENPNASADVFWKRRRAFHGHNQKIFEGASQ